MRCPSCGSSDIHRSRSGNQRLSIGVRLLVVALRCYACWTRFYRLRVLLSVSATLPSLAERPGFSVPTWYGKRNSWQPRSTAKSIASKVAGG